MTTTQDIRSLLDALDSASTNNGLAEKILKEFTGTLATIAVSVSDIAVALDRPEADDDSGLIAAIRSLTIPPPDVTVNVAAAQTPEVNVTVQPAQVVFMPSEEPAVKGWKLLVTNRDGNGAIREISMRPE